MRLVAIFTVAIVVSPIGVEIIVVRVDIILSTILISEDPSDSVGADFKTGRQSRRDGGLLGSSPHFTFAEPATIGSLSPVQELLWKESVVNDC